MHPELDTIKKIILYAIDRFSQADLYYGHGTDNPTDEAFALVYSCLHLSHDLEVDALDAKLKTEDRDKILALIELRVTKRIPIPYLTHEAWFCGLPFYVTEAVLIPRSPIAELIREQFQPWIEPDEVTHILDLCTGSGCIAIACAKYFPDAQVDASDISEAALAVAKINVEKHGVTSQVKLIQSDMFAQLPKKTYNIIVSNPPYVSREEMAELPDEYLHEPQQALAAENQGLAFAENILENAYHYLADDGILIVEVGNSEAALMQAYPNVLFTWFTFENSEDGGVFMLTKEQLKELIQ